MNFLKEKAAKEIFSRNRKIVLTGQTDFVYIPLRRNEAANNKGDLDYEYHDNY